MQTFAAKRVAKYYSKQLNTRISIERISVDFLKTIELHQLYIEDQTGDTLAYLNEFDLELSFYNFNESKFEGNLQLYQPIIHLNKKVNEEDFNYQFLSNYFGGNTTEGKAEFTVKVSGLVIDGGTFSYHDYHFGDSSNFFDADHFDVSDLNLNSTNLDFQSYYLKTRINTLSLKEKKGFALHNLEADLIIDSSNFLFSNLKVQTLGSEINADISFLADSMVNFRGFNSMVQLESTFRTSLVHIDDIAYFAPILKGIEDNVYLNGKINGTIDNLSGENIEIQLNKETILIGDFDLRGLPDVEKTFMQFDLQEFRTSYAGLLKLPYPPFDKGNQAPIPKNFKDLGTIYFTGNFTGFYNDFVAYGNFTSDLGNLKTDLSLKEKINGQYQYKGSIGSSGFNVGRFLDVEGMTKLSFDLNVDGSGLDAQSIDAKAKGKINSFAFRNYNYQNIVLNGHFLKKTFNGEVITKDPNLVLNFNGKINTNQKRPISRFNLNIQKANLAKLNLFNTKDSLTTLSFNAFLNIEGKDIDDIEGVASIDSLFYSDSRQEHQVDSFKLFASKIREQRKLSFESSILEAKLEGDFKLKQFLDAYKNLITDYIPNSEYEQREIDEQEFNFSVYFKNTTAVTEILIPKLKVDSSSKIEGSFSNRTNISNITFSGPRFQYDNSIAKDFNLSAISRSDTFKVDLKTEELKPFGLNSFDAFKVYSYLIDGKNETNISWIGIDKKLGSGKINVLNRMEARQKMQLSFFDSYITIKDSVWTINQVNQIEIDTSSVFINKLSVANIDQKITIDGTASKDSSRTLQLLLNSIDLDYISTLFPKETISLKGIINGNAVLRDIYKNFSLASDLSFDSLVINTIPVGDAHLQSRWVPKSKSVLVNGNLGKKSSQLLRIKGEIFPLNAENSLDLSVKMADFPVALVQPYIIDYLSNIEGSLNGNVRITGVAKKPILRGLMNLTEAKVKVNYLNTTYSITDEIIIEPDFIGFNLIDILDSKGQKAIATGTIFHENYSDFNLDIGLEFKNFMSLNTTSKDNNLFYGTAITSGTANIAGYAKQLIFEMDLTGEDGTAFKIPLNESVDVSSADYIIFTNSPEFETINKQEVDLSGIQLNFDLKILPAADIQIIFDEQIGDVIDANGTGNLKLEINTLGNFNMYGQYVVDKGDYLFTLQNIVNKKFDLAKGSRIFWDGDPYQAQLDMKAVYNLRAPLYDLFPEDSSAGFRRRIPVELELQMSNYLMSPEIGFDIRLPTADDNTKRRLESILYVNNSDVNRQEMNQQVFGLLVLNRFMPSASASAVSGDYDRGAPGLNNGYEFLSNQLSNWFSRVSDNFDIGLKYRPANELNSDEVDFSVSTEVLNDRLILDGNFGYIGNSDQYIDNSNNTSNFIGEFSAEYKLSLDGKFRVRGFNRSTQNSLLQLNSPYTQGVGLFYREEFDSMGELWRKYFSGKK